MVVKKDGRREKFDRHKVLSGLLRACEKRPISATKLENLVDETEAYLMDSAERERSTTEIGLLLMEKLKQLDTVSYIRFASVYRDFKDVNEFKEELEQLLTSKEPLSRSYSGRWHWPGSDRGSHPDSGSNGPQVCLGALCGGS